MYTKNNCWIPTLNVFYDMQRASYAWMARVVFSHFNLQQQLLNNSIS